MIGSKLNQIKKARSKEEKSYIFSFIRYNENLSFEFRWKGKCWFIHNLVRYDFDLQFEVKKIK